MTSYEKFLMKDVLYLQTYLLNHFYMQRPTGFHAVLSCKYEEPSPMTATEYNPVARGILTDANTIYTRLKVTEGQMKQLGQDIPVITFDPQL